MQVERKLGVCRCSSEGGGLCTGGWLIQREYDGCLPTRANVTRKKENMKYRLRHATAPVLCSAHVEDHRQMNIARTS